MLMALCTQTMQSRRLNPISPDQWAEDEIYFIDYDSGKFKVSKTRKPMINTQLVRPGRIA